MNLKYHMLLLDIVNYSICAKIDAQLFVRPLMNPYIMKILVIAWNWFFVNY
jgi:hypothetical protein